MVLTPSNRVGQGPAHSFSELVPALWAPPRRAGEKEPQSGPNRLCPELRPCPVAVGRAGSRAQRQSRAPAAPRPDSRGARCFSNQHSSGPFGRELSRRCRVQAGGGNPHGRRPQLPSEWGSHPLPNAMLARPQSLGPRTPGGGPKMAPHGTPSVPGPRGSPCAQGRTTLPSVLAVSRLGASPWLRVLPVSQRCGRLPLQRGLLGSSASCLPAPTGSAPGGGGGGRSLSPACRRGWRVQHRPCARDPPGLGMDAGGALAPVTPNACQPRAQGGFSPTCPTGLCRGPGGWPPAGPDQLPAALTEAPHKGEA